MIQCKIEILEYNTSLLSDHKMNRMRNADVVIMIQSDVCRLSKTRCIEPELTDILDSIGLRKKKLPYSDTTVVLIKDKAKFIKNALQKNINITKFMESEKASRKLFASFDINT